jgi:hypothetical protein
MKPPGNFPRRVGFLAVIYREGKEILAWLSLSLDGCHQHNAIRILYGNRSMRLFGQFTGFDDQRMPTDDAFDTDNTHFCTPHSCVRLP